MWLLEIFGLSLNSILFYSLIVLAFATVFSYLWYRRSKSEDNANPEKMEPIDEWARKKNRSRQEIEQQPDSSSLDILHEAYEERNPTHEVDIPITKPTTNPTQFDLKTELEKIFAKKIDSGEITLDLEPILDERVSKKDAFTIMGIPWMPKLKYANPIEKIEEKEEPISVPQEEVDVDAIPEGVIQEPEEAKPKKKKKAIVEEEVNQKESG